MIMMKLMVKTVLRNGQGRILLLMHDAPRAWLFLPGGRIHYTGEDGTSNGKPVHVEVQTARDMAAEITGFSQPCVGRESRDRAIRRRLVEELRNYGLIEADLRRFQLKIQRKSPPIPRIEMDSRNQPVAYFYVIATVTVPKSVMHRIERGVTRSNRARFVTKDEIRAARTTDDLPISPNLYDVLVESGIIRNGTPA